VRGGPRGARAACYARWGRPCPGGGATRSTKGRLTRVRRRYSAHLTELVTPDLAQILPDCPRRSVQRLLLNGGYTRSAVHRCVPMGLPNSLGCSVGSTIYIKGPQRPCLVPSVGGRGWRDVHDLRGQCKTVFFSFSSDLGNVSRNPSRHTPDHHLHSSPPGKRSTTPSQRISTPQTRLWMTTRDTPQQGSLSFSFYGGPIWYSTRWAQKRHQPHLSQHTHHSPRECERRNTRISSPIYIERPQRSEAVLCINEGLCSMFYVPFNLSLSCHVMRLPCAEPLGWGRSSSILPWSQLVCHHEAALWFKGEYN